MWQAWTIGVLGLWLALAPFTALDVPSVTMNNTFVGCIVITVAWYYLHEDKSWQRWATMILGIWVLIAGFIPALVEGYPYLWNNLIAGILMAVGGYALLRKNPLAEHR